MNASIRNIYIYKLLVLMRDYLQWKERGFESPSPFYIKQAVILRNGFSNATWIETGTYLGQTTRVLSKHATKVYSLEPEPTLFANAQSLFRNISNIEILNGTSEEVLPSLLPKVHNDVNFWLDGHYSAGPTFKGEKDTPIIEELREIANNLSHFRNVCVLIDDIRCFTTEQAEYSSYPRLELLVDWTRENNFRWHIEHDIFVARRSIRLDQSRRIRADS